MASNVLRDTKLYMCLYLETVKNIGDTCWDRIQGLELVVQSLIYSVARVLLIQYYFICEPIYWMVLSLGGVIFLGIGDTAAAILGKKYGVSKWSTWSNKSIEGTFYMCLATIFSYVLITLVVYPKYLQIFMAFIVATFLGCLSEGLTKQYDNLICTVLFYTLLLQSHNFFMELAYE